MKKLSYVTAMVVCFFLTSFTSNATGLRNGFNNYEIKSVDNFNLGKTVQQVWTLSYSNNETPVTVVKHKTFDGVVYTVKSKFFEVNYVSNSSGFGVREINNRWSDVPKKINRAVLNQKELKRQEIITPNRLDDEKALGLIACYLPDLLNDGYTHLLN